ncbi:DNA-binding transcriptional regulator, LysR family [Modicisalibacter muralis]|uniref:DNA-binding transcriptional regulator, LysR family n=1 Tax=Modicisalibacter muralis TaxID=119000 RepID=A0A1G9KJJ9_9GAMM|nr:LysR family transcriptional regulator [Halomonas muralis]SDL49687.1 DNA-binding transcriptional regulator, LysR family [Halomonas muralis]
MKNIPTDLLRTFVTIKDLGGFTSAGELLGRSQPAISLQIKKLEETLGTKLFLRGTSLALTADGEYLYASAKKMLEINDEIVNKIRGENISGKVRLGIPNDFELAFLPRVLRSFSKTYPNISVEVDCEISKVIQQRYHKNFYDIVLVMEAINANEERDNRDYRIEQLEWVMAHDYTPSRNEVVPLIAYPQGCIYRSITEELLTSHGIGYKAVYTSPSLLGLLSAVEAGLGITVMAHSTVPSKMKCAMTTAALPPLGQVCIGLYYKQEALGTAAQRVLDFLRAGIANLEKSEL